MPLTREHSELLRARATQQQQQQQQQQQSQQLWLSMAALPTGAPATVARRALRWLKYYAVINGFICAIALASAWLAAVSNTHGSAVGHAAVYAAGLARIVAVIKWFEWIATMKGRILGDKRHAPTRDQQRVIYVRILWLVVPTECLSYWVAQSRQTTSAVDEAFFPADAVSFVVEFASFIAKSLVFEITFDLFHYVAHWTCHQITWLYQHVHKRHHWHLHPTALSTYEQDGVDLILTNVVPFVLASQLSPAFSLFQLHLLFAYKTYVEVAGHCGLEVKGFSFPQMPLVNAFGICLRVHDHDLHHTHPRFNFAKRFSLWDKLFRTFQPGRPLCEDKTSK